MAPSSTTFEKEPGSPKEIAISLRTASFAVGLALVVIYLLWGMCTAY